MAPSAIDDIFASKGKRKGSAPPVASSSTPAASASTPVVTTSEKKKKSKKRKREDAAAEAIEVAEPSPLKKRVPETVLDPSVASTASGSLSSAKVKDTRATSKARPKSSKPSKKDNDGFADSRGTGPRKHTEEGWSVFKEDELGISAESGGTLPSSLRVILVLIHRFRNSAVSFRL
jgi:hypothetical protein